MFAQKKKVKEKKSRAVANSVAQKKNYASQHFKFAEKEQVSLIPLGSNLILKKPQLTVQRAIGWDGSLEVRNKYRPDKNPTNITSSIYKEQYNAITNIPGHLVNIVEDPNTTKGEGSYTNNGAASIIRIHPLVGEANINNEDFNNNIATLAHELQHAIDDIGTSHIDAYGLNKDEVQRANIIRIEWRAWAIQAAVNYQSLGDGSVDDLKINSHQKKMLNSFLNPDQMNLRADEFFRKTREYINGKVMIGNNAKLTEEQTQEWINAKGKEWLEESKLIFKTKTGR
ncbi:hypothetical protein [Shewanella surugensis]|uniref:Large polyvalent protein associated domain-containing protein n=1 Tax=Shewanella surugensis TaxID=212020 RepID=A0ABT0LG21_9GAMM|nr:hypothetical protein [Shewanella surugensis]MCL1126111.1 hypothetical protein [Shewanella surugensis]